MYLFWTTLLLGGVIGGIFGVAFNWRELTGEGAVNFLLGALMLFGFGCMFSVISQMGFFAYLTVHRFGISMFRSPSLWNGVLVVIVAFVLFDLFFFRFQAFRTPEESAVDYIWTPLFLLAVSWVVAFLKKRETNRVAFIPTLFFMVVVTTIEWYYTLKTNDPAWVWPVLAVLLACNAWQVLLLHRLLENKKAHTGS